MRDLNTRYLFYTCSCMLFCVGLLLGCAAFFIAASFLSRENCKITNSAIFVNNDINYILYCNFTYKHIYDFIAVESSNNVTYLQELQTTTYNHTHKCFVDYSTQIIVLDDERNYPLFINIFSTMCFFLFLGLCVILVWIIFKKKIIKAFETPETIPLRNPFFYSQYDSTNFANGL